MYSSTPSHKLRLLLLPQASSQLMLSVHAQLVRRSEILASCLCDVGRCGAWSNSLPNFGFLASSKIEIVFVRLCIKASGITYPLLLFAWGVSCY